MLQVTKSSQFFSPAGDFDLSSIPEVDRANITWIGGESPLGAAVVQWVPDNSLSSLAVLKANQPYMVKSTSELSIDVEVSGWPDHDDYITKRFQMFTYEGGDEFDLEVGLSSDVKSKIGRIVAEGDSDEGPFRYYIPGDGLSTLSKLVHGQSYLVISKVESLPYNLGIPSQGSIVNSDYLPELGTVPDRGIIRSY